MNCPRVAIRFAQVSFLLAVAGCPAGDGPADAGGGGQVEVIDDVRTETRWTADKTYVLKAAVFVDGATLTIEAGTLIRAESGSSLVVAENGRLIAEGTQEKPIVLTSSKAVGSRAAGDWGGVVLLGKAPTNLGGQGKVEGFPARETRTVYGGSDPTHSCGRLKYLRIEFAGQLLTTDNELNGLTMAGCGSDTLVDFVQVHRGLDDGVEIFGGTVDLKHVLITYADDDGLDWDNGWSGKVQQLAVVQSKDRGNFGLECDNQTKRLDNVTKGDENAMPRSAPQLWNVTVVGSNAEPGAATSGGKAVKQGGLAFRSGTDATLRNFVLTALADQVIDVQTMITGGRVTGGTLTATHGLFFDNANLNATFPPEAVPDPDGIDESTLFTTSTNARFVDPMLGPSAGSGAPKILPLAGSPALTGGATPPAGFFDATATFVGAFGANDWTAGWAAYPES